MLDFKINPVKIQGNITLGQIDNNIPLGDGNFQPSWFPNLVTM